MKKGFFLIMTLFVLSFSFAASTVNKLPPLMAKDILIPIGNTGQKVSLLDLSRMSVKDVESFTGKKMNLVDRLGFLAAQHKLRMSINHDGTLDSKKFEKGLKKSDVTSGFHLGGFALGFFLTIIGVLIAYLINDDKKAARVKWAWIGFAISLVIWIIVAVA